jgi:hypothetical protein
MSKGMRECQDVIITVRDLSSLWEGNATGKWQREVTNLHLAASLLACYNVCFCKLRNLRECLRSDVVPECPQ